MKFVLATTNLHKILELRGMLKPLIKGDILSLRDFPYYTPPEETGASFEENASIKAGHAASTLGVIALADDSGLVVPALGGEPGIYSARYAGEDASDRENRLKLIEKLKTLKESERIGYFECTLALATPGKVVKTTIGYSEGRLLLEERGRSGFGYDSLFIKHEYSKTFAELDEATKSRISHRRKALDKLTISLEAIITHV
jgi:XTP/dITP diphosphohydrolase